MTARSIGRALAVVVMAVALAAGCASIPDHGSVATIAGDLATAEPPARIKPALPGSGSSPAQVVNGFLLAMMASPVRYDIARRFLTPDAAADWKPRLRTTVYSQASVTAIGVNDDAPTVALGYRADAALSERGRYAVGTGAQRTSTLRLEKVDGQWRVDNPPDGLLVSRDFFEGYYLPLDLYFFDRTGRQILADPVYVSAGDQVTTALMTSLLRGTEGFLRNQARSYLPPDLRLDVSVPVRVNGVADVKLRGRVADLTTQARERLAAQVVWTVRQVPNVTGVRITVDGAPFVIPGVDPVQAVDAWDRFDASNVKGRSQLFALRAGRLVVVDGPQIAQFAGSWGDRATTAVDLRVDPSLARIAVVPPGRRTVRTAPLGDSSKLRTVYTGTDVLRPIWDSAGHLWVVDRTSRGPVLTVLDAKTPRQVPLGPLATRVLTTFELSADNAHFLAVARPAGAATTASQVLVGVLVRDPKDNRVVGVADVRALPLAASDVSRPLSAAWRSATSVAVLGSLDASYPQVFLAGIDGSSITGATLSREAVLPDVGASSVVSSGVAEASTYVADRRGRLWLQNAEGRWQQVSNTTLQAVGYPG